jgi:hypothetical protein
MGNNWFLVDSMRGIASGGDDSPLRPNLSGNEYLTNQIALTSTGFILENTDAITNSSGSTYIYMAIRAPMMVEPESGTEVFKAELFTASTTTFTPNFPPDLNLQIGVRASGGGIYTGSRLTGDSKYLQTASTAAEGSYSSYSYGLATGTFKQSLFQGTSSGGLELMFKRAKGFMDVVAYTGHNSNATKSHSLGVVPEMVLVKNRITTNYSWAVYHKDSSGQLALDTNSAKSSIADNRFSNLTSTSFDVDPNNNQVNVSSYTYIAYLFATLEGVSKVGSYTGTGTTLNIDCGFSTGARFVLIKRIDAVGYWQMYDTARGITTGNDPYLNLDTTGGEQGSTDYIDPYSAGFTLTPSFNSVNTAAATYIFLAIA